MGMRSDEHRYRDRDRSIYVEAGIRIQPELLDRELARTDNVLYVEALKRDLETFPQEERYMAYTTRDVSEGDSIIYGRDVERRMDELRNDRESILGRLDGLEFDSDNDLAAEVLHEIAVAINDCKDELKAWDESDDGEEYRKLKELWDQIPSRDTDLICDDYFETYARETAEGTHGTMMGEWPFASIDWDQACRDLQCDYSSAEFGTTTYWYRS